MCFQVHRDAFACRVLCQWLMSDFKEYATIIIKEGRTFDCFQNFIRYRVVMSQGKKRSDFTFFSTQINMQLVREKFRVGNSH